MRLAHQSASPMPEAFCPPFGTPRPRVNFLSAYSGSQISSVSDGTRSVSYGYSSGNLTSFIDALGQSTTFAYDTSGSQDTAGHLTQVFYPSNPSNAFVTNFYDSLGRVRQQKDANGNLTQAFFAGARTEIDDPVGNRHVWYNDSRGNVTNEDSRLRSFAASQCHDPVLLRRPKQSRQRNNAGRQFGQLQLRRLVQSR